MRRNGNIVTYTDDELKEMIARGESETDWDYVRSLTYEEIEASIDFEDEGEFDFSNVIPGLPPMGPKQQITVRFDLLKAARKKPATVRLELVMPDGIDGASRIVSETLYTLRGAPRAIPVRQPGVMTQNAICRTVSHDCVGRARRSEFQYMRGTGGRMIPGTIISRETGLKCSGAIPEVMQQASKIRPATQPERGGEIGSQTCHTNRVIIEVLPVAFVAVAARMGEVIHGCLDAKRLEQRTNELKRLRRPRSKSLGTIHFPRFCMGVAHCRRPMCSRRAHCG